MVSTLKRVRCTNKWSWFWEVNNDLSNEFYDSSTENRYVTSAYIITTTPDERNCDVILNDKIANIVYQIVYTQGWNRLLWNLGKIDYYVAMSAELWDVNAGSIEDKRAISYQLGRR